VPDLRTVAARLYPVFVCRIWRDMRVRETIPQHVTFIAVKIVTSDITEGAMLHLSRRRCLAHRPGDHHACPGRHPGQGAPPDHIGGDLLNGPVAQRCKIGEFIGAIGQKP